VPKVTRYVCIAIYFINIQFSKRPLPQMSTIPVWPLPRWNTILYLPSTHCCQRGTHKTWMHVWLRGIYRTYNALTTNVGTRKETIIPMPALHTLANWVRLDAQRCAQLRWPKWVAECWQCDVTPRWRADMFAPAVCGLYCIAPSRSCDSCRRFLQKPRQI